MWLIFVFMYIILAVIFTQFYKIVTKTAKSDETITILLQITASISALLFLPLFPFTLPKDLNVYIFLGLACIFYAIADRLNTTVRRGIEASTFSIIEQLSTLFMILAGLLFFKEPFVWQKIISGMLIIFSNILIFYKNGNQKLNKYVILGIIANLSFSIALFLDVNISNNFNLAFYVALTLLLPAIFIIIAERIKLPNIKRELQNCNKKNILITGVCWGTMLIFQLKAYQVGDVTSVAPLCALTVIGNVIVGYLFLKERDNLLKKIIAAIIIIISIFLIKR